ncbi:MAG: T9SS type A sorting domain-containing protein [Melioribacteraceae bacterium]|nr:T9SS type A sorting domain-containing protein [Melioribacteraceae bacterium]
MFYRIVFFIILLNSLLQAQGTWREVTKMPRPVTEAQIIYNESQSRPQFYIIGGYSDIEQRTVNWIQIYDIFNNTWELIENGINFRRKNFSAALWDSSIVLFGGLQNEVVSTPNAELFSLSKRNSTIFEPSDKYVFDRVYGNCFISKDTLFVLGGNVKSQPYVSAFNLKSKKEVFTVTYQPAEALLDEMGFFKDGFFYLFGGVRFVITKGTKYFDQKKRMVSETPVTLLEPRAGGAAIYNSRLGHGLVIGGYNEGRKALSSVEFVLFNNDNTFSIYRTGSINFARRNPMAANYANTIFLFGGRDADGNIVSQVEQYISSVSDITEESAIPTNFNLFQNYPNPFNPNTSIKFSLPKESNVELKVYNLFGEEVALLLKRFMPVGNHSISFDASGLPSGTYFYKLTAGEYSQAKKMLLLK